MTPKTRLAIRIDSGMGKIGARQIAFLEAIKSQGSISAASRFTGLSYSGARLVIEGINRALGEPSVSAVKGGGAALTPAGRQLVQLYRAIEIRVQAVAAIRI
jgi:molybdate transport system regulatory protein